MGSLSEDKLKTLACRLPLFCVRHEKVPSEVFKTLKKEPLGAFHLIKFFFGYPCIQQNFKSSFSNL